MFTASGFAFSRARCEDVIAIVGRHPGISQVVIDRPPTFIVHCNEERLVKSQGKLVVGPDGLNVCIAEVQPPLDYEHRLVGVILGVLLCPDKGTS